MKLVLKACEDFSAPSNFDPNGATNSKYAISQSEIAPPKFELRSNFAYLRYVI